MSSRNKKYVAAKKKGLTDGDIFKLKMIAREEAQKMEAAAVDRAFLYMLAIPLNILVNDYWSKTAKSKMPKFIAETLKLYEAVQDGVVSDNELSELLYDMAGVKLEAEWLKYKRG